MKLLTAAFLLFSSLSFAQTGTNPSDSSQAQFSLNQANQVLNLEKKNFETIYRTDQVPDTCYRSEVQGTRTECHTEYDRECHMESRQDCHYENYPVCRSEPRQSCSSHQVCETQMDSVCNSHGCTSVPRRVCHNEESCNTHYENVCHNDQRYECRTVPDQVCHDIPRQACSQVPNVVQVPYACTKPVQVPIGQQLKLDTRAVVNLSFTNFTEVGALSDSFTANLNNGIVSIKPNQASALYLFQATQTRSEQVVSATEKLVTYQFTIQATPIQKLNDFLNLTIDDLKFYQDHLEFGFKGGFNLPLKGHLAVSRRRTLNSPETVIESDFGSKAIVTQGAVNQIMYNSLASPPLGSNYYYLTLTLGIDVEALKANVLNPDAIALIQNKTIQNSVAGYPY